MKTKLPITLSPVTMNYLPQLPMVTCHTLIHRHRLIVTR